MHSYSHDILYQRFNLSLGVIRLTLIFIFLLSLSLSFGVTYDKFTYAEDVSFSIINDTGDDHYGVYSGYVVLWPDEITYLNWIFTRGDSFEQTITGERGFSTNLYGYLISGIYLISGFNWKILFLIGVFNFIIFYYSSLKLLNYFCKDRPYLIILSMSLIALSPSVINLSSGFMRDLMVLAIINFSLLSILYRKAFSFILCILLIFLLRNFMVVVLVPIYVYFFFYFRQTILGFNKSACLLLISIILGFSLYILLHMIGAVNKDIFEVVLRFAELITGLNTVIFNADEAWFAEGAVFVEMLSQSYQFMIVMLIYTYIIMNKLKINSLLIAILGTCLLLAILYGSFLGFFVARTKLIILWLLIFYMTINTTRKPAVSGQYHSSVC